MQEKRKVTAAELRKQASRGNVRGVRATRPDSKLVSIGFKCDPYIKETLVKIAELSRRSLSIEIIIALEKHLQTLGLWPPPEEVHDPKSHQH